MTNEGPVRVHSVRFRRRLVVVEADRYIFSYTYVPGVPVAKQKWLLAMRSVVGTRNSNVQPGDQVAKLSAIVARQMARSAVDAWVREHPTERLEDLSDTEIWLHPEYCQTDPAVAERNRRIINTLTANLARHLSFPPKPPPA